MICSVSYLCITMANTPIALSRTIISLWIGIQAYRPQVTSFSSLRDNYVMAYENNTWADNQMKKAQNKCREYTRYACLYKTPNAKNVHMDRILNGEYVSEGMLPHMAFLLFILGRNRGRTCSGTLISEKFVMTAAHCTFGTVCAGRQVKIKLGSLDTTNDRTGRWYGVDHIYDHPYFKDADADRIRSAKAWPHDIALIELSETVHFNRNIRPICLNTNYEISEYNSAIAAGWGHTEHGQTNFLKMVELQLKESHCDLAYQEHIVYSDIAKSYTICAAEDQKNICMGDSGGPLHVLMNDTCPNMYEQIGVAANSVGECSLNCTYSLAIFTKVSLYVPWIASIVWPEEGGT
ncbi:chymotrypsin-like elastase family member 1 [Planococcus citri]|uniref:chymotrypsin-like elastase family member 1 n=1 Tax=Planococcus citri TaxID=170843 RepID=UPI0031F75DC6